MDIIFKTILENHGGDDAMLPQATVGVPLHVYTLRHYDYSSIAPRLRKGVITKVSKQRVQSTLKHSLKFAPDSLGVLHRPRHESGSALN